MNAIEYNQRVMEVLHDIPIEFHQPFLDIAYEHSHAYGYDEVLYDLQDLVDKLLEPIREYGWRMRALL